MRIQANLPRNPYATLALMTRQGPVGADGGAGLLAESRAPLAGRPMPGLSHAAPLLRSQLAARIERFEGLGEQITSLRTVLNRFTPSRTASGGFTLGALSVSLPAAIRMPESRDVPAGPSGGLPGETDATPNPAGSPAASSGVPSPSSQTRTVLHSAVMLSTQRISLTPPGPGAEGTPAQRAVLSTADLVLKADESTRAELRGEAITFQAEGNGKVRFGDLTINGQKISFSTFDVEKDGNMGQFLAKRINEKVTGIGIEARVEDNRLVLRSRASGPSTITITDVANKSNSSAWTGFREGMTAQGLNDASNLGDVTINGIRTEFGTQKHASVKDALAFMAARLNEDHADLEAAVDGNHLVLTSKGTGGNATITVDDVKRGTLDHQQDSRRSSNGFTAGVSARGTDGTAGTPSDPGSTDFGSLTINGVTTAFGRLDNRDYTAESAARFLAQRINETNESVRASVEDGRLKLVSTQQGAGALIRIDAIAADSDGVEGNDRPIGFVTGDQAAGRETTLTTGGSGSSATPQGPADAPGASRRVGGASTERSPRLSEAETVDLSTQLKEWTRLTNDYLKALDTRSEAQAQGAAELKAFGRTIGAMLKQDADLSAIGVKVEGGRLSLDEERLMNALTQEPEATLGAIGQFRDTLDPLLASQAYAMDFLREVATSTQARIPEISQAKAMQFKLELRSKEVAGYLDSLEKLMPTLSEQGDRLSKLGAPDEDDEDDARKRSWSLDRSEEDALRKPKPWETEDPRGLAPLWSVT